MVIVILSTIMFVLPILLFSIGYVYNDYKIKEINNKINIENEKSKKLESIYYDMLDK